MKPKTLQIAGFGPHADTTIEFSRLGSPVAVVAPYGTGKTFLIEGAYAALYGSFLWYSGSIYDAMTQGGSGDAALTLQFSHAKCEYMAERKFHVTGKTRSQTATLRLLVDGIWAPVAGPKVGDFDAAIRALVGDADTAAATWFLSQNRRNDLCGQPGESDLVARRRAVFNELIGASSLDALAKRFGEEAGRRETLAAELEAQLAGEPDHEARIVEEEAGLERQRAALERGRADLAEAEEFAEGAKKRVRDAGAGDEILLAEIEAYERGQKNLEEAMRRVEDARAEVLRLEATAARRQQAAIDLHNAGNLKEHIGRLEEQAQAFRAWEVWLRQKGDLQRRMEASEKTIEAIEAASGVDDETRARAAQLDKWRDLYKETALRNKEIETENEKRDAQKRRLEAELLSAKREVAEATKRRDARPETPGGEVCETCPLLKEYNGLDAVIERASAQVAALEEQLAGIPNKTPLADLETIIKHGEEAKAAAAAVERARDNERRLASAREQLRTAMGLLDQHEEAKPAQVEDPSAQLKSARAELATLDGAAERLSQAQAAAEQVREWREKAVVIEAALEEARANAEAWKARAERARAALADRDAQLARLKKEAAVFAEDVRVRRAQVEEIAAWIARHEEILRRDQAALQASRAKRERAAQLRDEEAGYRDLRACFGPRGVRQILIDDAAPELEAIADDLFERATGGAMRLRIATQAVNRDGSLKEDFSILIRDARGERDALRFSGGQLQLILIIFRIAVAIWIGRLHGARPDCLFLDEAFDRLGADGSEALLSLLDYLGGQLSLIVVVTHDPQIAERLAGQVRLSGGAGGVIVEAA